MSIVDEIDRLAAQRNAGHLTDAEFEAAKARVFAQPQSTFTSAPSFGATSAEGAVTTINNLRRSSTDRWIAGVCGGLAKMLGIESWIVRLLFVLCLFFAGFGLLPYLLLWIFVPSEH